jgi:hypothetical protein
MEAIDYENSTISLLKIEPSNFGDLQVPLHQYDITNRLNFQDNHYKFSYPQLVMKEYKTNGTSTHSNI